MESRTSTSPTVLAYMDSFIGMFQTGGFPIELTHHVMHAIGSRMWGFTQELFDGPPAPSKEPPEPTAQQQAAMAQLYPHIAAVMVVASHEDDTVVGSGCDDQYEFEFALDLLLDGIERLRAARG
jgi:hypothetical protein